MDQQPKIPTLKDAQKPQVKIKGMGAGLTLFDRLKQFKKKDLAFILAGLGTLFMAPLAEHFMMAPENGDASLQQGWGKGGGAGNLFGGGSSPYESGNNNIASGGAIGGAGDIITPLNVRDPSALVMGPGAAQQPNAGSAAPAAPPPAAPARSETDYKDALAGAASRAASAAVKRAPLPVPKVALGGSGLRGLGVAGGGTSASGSLGPIGPAAGSTGGGGGGSLNLVRNAPGFRSAAGARSPTGGTGLDGTKKAGANAGDAFSRTGSALSGLNAAASEQIPTGGHGFGGGGHGGSGANDKPYSGSGPGGSKSIGESLAFLAMKQRQEEELKLEFEKRKLKDPELLLYGIRNDSLKAMAAEMTKSLTKGIIGFMDPSNAAGSSYSCSGTFNGSMTSVPKPACPEKGPFVDCAQETAAGFQWFEKGPAAAYSCKKVGATKDPAADPKTEQSPSPGFPGLNEGQVGSIANLGTVCSDLDTLINATGSSSTDDTLLKSIRAEATKYAALRDALYQGQNAVMSNDCKTVRAEVAKDLDAVKTAVAKQQRDALDKLALAEKGLIPTLKKDAEGVEEKDYAKEYNTAKEVVDAARADLETVRTFAGEKLAKITPTTISWSTALQNVPGNKEKLAKIEKTVSGSRAGLTTALDGQIAAQDLLDGGKDKDNTKVLPQLGNIIGVPDGGKTPIALTKEVNSKYKDLEEKDPKVKITVETVAEKYDPTKIGIEKGAEDIDTRIADVKAKVAAAKAKDPKVDLSKDDPTVKAVQLAKSAMLGTRAAQTTWLDNVNAMVTTARSTVPNK
ncbi:MAG: hypothetical protein HYV14_03195 [Elusimicrobia bacterium]|nr:hypothetical protein [Elusimicrobiota bacterium]